MQVAISIRLYRTTCPRIPSPAAAAGEEHHVLIPSEEAAQVVFLSARAKNSRAAKNSGVFFSIVYGVRRCNHERTTLIIKDLGDYPHRFPQKSGGITAG